MTYVSIKKSLLAILLLLVAIVGASAQNLQNGAIRGFVYDTTHSGVPNAKLALTNTATGIRRELTSQDDGSYDFENIPPGQYTLVAEAPGFAVTTVKGIVVNVGAALSLDVNMPLKSVPVSAAPSVSAASRATTTAWSSMARTPPTTFSAKTSARSKPKISPFPSRPCRNFKSSPTASLPSLAGRRVGCSTWLPSPELMSFTGKHTNTIAAPISLKTMRYVILRTSINRTSSEVPSVFPSTKTANGCSSPPTSNAITAR